MPRVFTPQPESINQIDDGKSSRRPLLNKQHQDLILLKAFEALIYHKNAYVKICSTFIAKLHTVCTIQYRIVCTVVNCTYFTVLYNVQYTHVLYSLQPVHHIL